MKLSDKGLCIGGFAALALASGYVQISKSSEEVKSWHNPQVVIGCLLLLTGLALAARMSLSSTTGNMRLATLIGFGILGLYVIYMTSQSGKTEKDDASWLHIFSALVILCISWSVTKDATGNWKFAGLGAGVILVLSLFYVLPRARQENKGPDSIGVVMLCFSLAFLTLMQSMASAKDQMDLPQWVIDLKNKLVQLGQNGLNMMKSPSAPQVVSVPVQVNPVTGLNPFNPVAGYADVMTDSPNF